ncbi:WD40 repeat domain-containing protein [Streptomyces sp. NBC_01233]|uniref:WD40 repeat domain-containing protein n=1 Tax=Streptomyces sp. NBC_01233 TaxID=2903787 RepID=UPI003FA3A359
MTRATAGVDVRPGGDHAYGRALLRAVPAGRPARARRHRRGVAGVRRRARTAGRGDTLIRFWDVAKRTGIYGFDGHTGDVASAAFSPNGRTLASGSGDRTIRLWDLASRTTTATLTGHTSDVASVAFSPDGKALASGSRDSTVRLWKLS